MRRAPILPSTAKKKQIQNISLCSTASSTDLTLLGHLRDCTHRKDLAFGRLCYDHLVQDALEIDSFWSDQIIRLFAVCGDLVEASHVFDKVAKPSIYTWNAIISAHVQLNDPWGSFQLYKKLHLDGLTPPDRLTYLWILKACTLIYDVIQGRIIQIHIILNGLGRDHVLLNTLIGMFAKCGSFGEAEQVFDGLLVRDQVSWGALISGYVQNGHGLHALKLYESMQEESITPDRVLLLCITKAIATIGGEMTQGRIIFNEVVKNGLELDVAIASCIIDMYGKCGSIEEAKFLFYRLPKRNVVSWGSLIGAFLNQGSDGMVLDLYTQMRQEGIVADRVIFLGVLKACGSIGAIDKGKEIHNLISNKGLLKKDVMLGTAVVDMYAKCGVLEKAHQVLEGLPIRNVFSWSALIAGYAQQGQGHKAMRCFEHMQGEGLFPDEVTFLCVLNACTHSGLLDDAQTYFQSMSKYYGITPSLEHHTCMAVSLGCIGHFDKVISMIKTMPSSSYLPVWRALLSACQRWGNVKLGSLAFDQAMQLDDSSSSSYILMANLYAASGMQEDAESIEAMRRKMMVGRI